MAQFAEPLARLIEELRKLPGIGAKSAQRLAFHILRSSSEDAGALARFLDLYSKLEGGSIDLKVQNTAEGARGSARTSAEGAWV